MEKAKNTIIISYTDGTRCSYPQDNLFRECMEIDVMIKFLCKLRCVTNVAWAHKGKIYGSRPGRGHMFYQHYLNTGRV